MNRDQVLDTLTEERRAKYDLREACKQLVEQLEKEKLTDVGWQKVAQVRAVLSHHYTLKKETP